MQSRVGSLGTGSHFLFLNLSKSFDPFQTFSIGIKSDGGSLLNSSVTEHFVKNFLTSFCLYLILEHHIEQGP